MMGQVGFIRKLNKLNYMDVTLFHIKIFHVNVTLSSKKFQHMGHKWVICGSHPDCSVGQWRKWVNCR